MKDKKTYELGREEIIQEIQNMKDKVVFENTNNPVYCLHELLMYIDSLE